jgi:hypothetical protein
MLFSAKYSRSRRQKGRRALGRLLGAGDELLRARLGEVNRLVVGDFLILRRPLDDEPNTIGRIGMHEALHLRAGDGGLRPLERLVIDDDLVLTRLVVFFLLHRSPPIGFKSDQRIR